MNNKEINPTIPSFKVYENPETQYQFVVNRFCQSKSKLVNCVSKKEVIGKANAFWQDNKSDKPFCDSYIQSPSTYPVKKVPIQPTILSFTKKNQNPTLNNTIKENNDKKVEDSSQNKLNKKSSKRKADQMIIKIQSIITKD